MSSVSSPAVQRVKVALGLLLGLGIGAMCRFLAIPSPAPPVLPGALLVVAMTVGYIAADRWLCRRQALHAHLCGGPDGRAPSAARRVDPTA
jgi:XapX domain-containing protein